MPGTTGQPSAPEKNGGKTKRRSTGERARSGAVLVLAVLIILFAVENSNEVQVDWLLGSGKAPLIIVILITLLVGIVITYLAGRMARHRKR
jgi:uncharacterized integral membrane protein